MSETTREIMYIGPTPPDEKCAQVGTEDYYSKGRKECQTYIGCLRRALGNEPEGARLAIKREEHDFGAYQEVVCYYDPESREAVEYALKCEGEGPANWDDEARKELGL